MAKDIKDAPPPRRTWMSVLAQADEAELLKLWAMYGAPPDFDWLRTPECGGVMVRGRMGGTGAPFNLGEMTVTRCSVTLKDGTIGHGYVQGRSKAKAQAAALIDALMQGDPDGRLYDAVIAPLAAMQQADKASRASKAAATKVEFFTMVRGEDA